MMRPLPESESIDPLRLSPLPRSNRPLFRSLPNPQSLASRTTRNRNPTVRRAMTLSVQLPALPAKHRAVQRSLGAAKTVTRKIGSELPVETRGGLPWKVSTESCVVLQCDMDSITRASRIAVALARSSYDCNLLAGRSVGSFGQ